jgi:hypothetical protein
VTVFTGNGLKFHVALLKKIFFSDGKARVFATDIKNLCFKNWRKPLTKLRNLFKSMIGDWKSWYLLYVPCNLKYVERSYNIKIKIGKKIYLRHPKSPKLDSIYPQIQQKNLTYTVKTTFWQQTSRYWPNFVTGCPHWPQLLLSALKLVI